MAKLTELVLCVQASLDLSYTATLGNLSITKNNGASLSNLL